MNAYLSHHGILGMKWGVRRWQNADGSLTAAGKKHYGYGSDYDKGARIKKGTTIYRTSFDPNERHDNSRTYAAVSKRDGDIYAYRGKKMGDLMGGKAHQYEMVTKEDLKMPSRSKMVDMYLELMRKKNPDDKILNKGRAFQEKAFDKFQYNLVKPKQISQEYFAYCQLKGYNALMDTADMRQKLSETPIIVIDRGKSLMTKLIRELDSSNTMSDKEYSKVSKEIEERLRT